MLNIVALGVQLVVAVMIAWSRIAGTVLALAIGYSTLHRIYLKGRFNKGKWEIEERRRAQALSVAFERLSDCVKDAKIEADDLDHIERCALDALLSEAEALLGETEGVYVNANLLIEDRADTSMLFCLNRANPHRRLHKRYAKTEMVTWQAMQERRTIYVPHFSSGDTSVPYRSLMILPILDDVGEGIVLGAVSIDSEISDHFEGREAKLASKLLPYVTLLKLALVCRARYHAWPEALFRVRASAGATGVAPQGFLVQEGQDA